MKQKKNPNLHVVRPSEDEADVIVNHIMRELQEEDDTIEVLEEKIRRHKKEFWRRTIIGTIAVLMVMVGSYFLIVYQEYNTVRILNSYDDQGTGNSNYVAFADGVLRYSKDGIAYLNEKGKEQWNQPCQMQNPFVEIRGEAVAVADRNGNNIMVFQKDGLKGEMETTLPIEKIAVSGQGIVSVILKDETSPRVVCYDAAGNMLVEHKISVSSTGYPVDVSISPNGYMLIVSYMDVLNGIPTAKLAYYNFQSTDQENENSQVVSEEFKDLIIPTTFFMGNEYSVVVGDSKILIYQGANTPKLKQTIDLDKRIKSVFYDDKYIGLILKNDGSEGNELRMYNRNGRQVLSTNFDGDYSHVKLFNDQIMMFDGMKCTIFTKAGVQRFEGELQQNILEMFPVFGVNKYLVMNADGLQEIRLVK